MIQGERKDEACGGVCCLFVCLFSVFVWFLFVCFPFFSFFPNVIFQDYNENYDKIFKGFREMTNVVNVPLAFSRLILFMNLHKYMHV